jgi:hypothetical protein
MTEIIDPIKLYNICLKYFAVWCIFKKFKEKLMHVFAVLISSVGKLFVFALRE